jgi:hypothetical protein
MPAEYWNTLRKKLKARNGLTMLFGRAAIPGTFTAEAYHEDCPMPLCVVWFGFFGLQGIQIQNSFTFEYVRRAGLRSFIHEQMVKAYPDRYVLSGAGTKSGEAWMKAVGYRKTAAGWEWHPKKTTKTE